MCLEAADADVPFALGRIAKDLASLLFFALVADVAGDGHGFELLD